MFASSNRNERSGLRRAVVLVRASAAALALGGCTSAAISPASSTPAPPSAPQTVLGVACDASQAPPPWPIERLSVREYERTVTDLFSSYKSCDGVAREVSMDLGQLPRDGEPSASFSNMDHRTSQRHVDTFTKVAESVALAITSHEERLAAIAGACALASRLESGCLRSFVTDFGLRAWRRPLTAVELGRLTAATESLSERPRDAYREILTELLAAPEFVLHLDLPEAGAGAAGGRLSPYALAARLSYHFWQTLPDQRLLGAAASGALDTDAGYRAEVERLVSSQRAHATWFRFFREWLQLEEFGGFSLDRAFENFSGGLKPTVALYEDAVWEIEQLVGYYTYDTQGTYEQLLSSDLIVTRSPRLASLYGVEPWDGASVPRPFPPGQRSGLLTRAAVLMSGSHATNPFHRGAFVQRRVLCEPVEPPAQRPPEAFVLPVFDPRASTRTRYERKVESGACVGCHDLFSPYGYALEAYDALGRFRTSERLVDDAGDAHGRVPVDDRVTIALTPEQPVVADGPVALSRAIATSSVGSACFARQYFRFTFRRQETPADACALETIATALREGGLLAAYRDVAFSTAFRRATAALPDGAREPSPSAGRSHEIR
jgi:Protein of unknown function (DUF1592)/Protein of unknown function (DUF1588)/Protein of unknown function (DUF1595)/Protein of unknown function (DUF1585)/Protein of unknown function (DUF1587)